MNEKEENGLSDVEKTLIKYLSTRIVKLCRGAHLDIVLHSLFRIIAWVLADKKDEDVEAYLDLLRNGIEHLREEK